MKRRKMATVFYPMNRTRCIETGLFKIKCEICSTETILKLLNSNQRIFTKKYFSYFVSSNCQRSALRKCIKEHMNCHKIQKIEHFPLENGFHYVLTNWVGNLLHSYHPRRVVFSSRLDCHRFTYCLQEFWQWQVFTARKRCSSRCWKGRLSR